MENTGNNKSFPLNNKDSQKNDERSFHNRRMKKSFDEKFQENNLISKESKIRSVKPMYKSATSKAQNEDVKFTQTMSRKNEKRQFDGMDEVLSTNELQKNQTEHEVKNVDKRKNYYHPKENRNTRFYRANGERTRKQAPRKDENYQGGRKSNRRNTSQNFKPAVHVQPLQQSLENLNLQSTNEPSTIPVCLSNVSSNNVTERSQNIRQSDQVSSPTNETVTVDNARNEEKLDKVQRLNTAEQNFANDNHMNEMKPLFSNETPSLADLNTNGLGNYLSSSISTSENNTDLRQKSQTSLANHNSLVSSQLSVSNNDVNVNTLLPVKSAQQDLHEQHQTSTQQHEDHRITEQVVPQEKYFRISVDSLFSTSFFTEKHHSHDKIADANVDGGKEKTANNKTFLGSEREVHFVQQFSSESSPNFSSMKPDGYNTDKQNSTMKNIFKKESRDSLSPRQRSKNNDMFKEVKESGNALLGRHGAVPLTGLKNDRFLNELKQSSTNDGNTSNEQESLTHDEDTIEHFKYDSSLECPMTQASIYEGPVKENTVDVSSNLHLDPHVHLSPDVLNSPLNDIQTVKPVVKQCNSVGQFSLTGNYGKIHTQSSCLSSTKHILPDETNQSPPALPIPVLSNSLPSNEAQHLSTCNEIGTLSKNSPPSNNSVQNPSNLSFPQIPYVSNPFLRHSLLSHRPAIPSAFVFPSRVGINNGHSTLGNALAHRGNNQGHVFLHHGNTICLNVGGRIFEILPSTFSPYPDSILWQIFTGNAPASINQRGQIFFDRDGYLFEIILSFARVGCFTIPSNINLNNLINEAKFFGMFKYMFEKGQISSGNILHFQRTTRCTLSCDLSAKTQEKRVFVLQGNDKLKIESLKVNGSCSLFVDLYTPCGIKETSDFMMYTADKPDLWKAYQFCAERQLVFHLKHTGTEKKLHLKSSVDIVFVQTFMFKGEDFIP
ncbi:uncharacterized protein LOC124447507 isoform X2 [Xenia sp. Carnegie-2017]|uniref:uncharacterized protein LOC124447507 isoform X2 n=1 Tax=Xenia sp. Carnegie-2017 TaxID=2897299 RepID=UPI001F04C053|nr:uncharacterized protein LOC124447507 isoform X2 [Xenia sp. Carnegie-2017]